MADLVVEARGRVSEGWRGEQERMGRTYLLPHLEKLPLGEIRSRDISEVIEAAHKKGLGQGMLRHIYNLMHKAFDDAIEPTFRGLGV